MRKIRAVTELTWHQEHTHNWSVRKLRLQFMTNIESYIYMYNGYVCIIMKNYMNSGYACLSCTQIYSSRMDVKDMHSACAQLTSFWVMKLVEFPLAYAVWTTPTHVQTHMHTSNAHTHTHTHTHTHAFSCNWKISLPYICPLQIGTQSTIYYSAWEKAVE